MARSKIQQHRREVSLTAKEIVFIFRDRIENRSGMYSKNLDWEFFRPEDSGDPFADFSDEPDPDAFIGASYGMRGSKLAPFVGQSQLRSMAQSVSGGSVFLSVWDRGSDRLVEIHHQGNLSPLSKKVVKSILQGLDEVEPAARSPYQQTPAALSATSPSQPPPPPPPNTDPTPPQWLPDPIGRHGHRYWDGAAWTGYVSDSGVTSEDPLT